MPYGSERYVNIVADRCKRGMGGVPLRLRCIIPGVIDRHGGRIPVESTPGVGTTFFFILPATTIPETSTDKPVEPKTS